MEFSVYPSVYLCISYNTMKPLHFTFHKELILLLFKKVNKEGKVNLNTLCNYSVGIKENEHEIIKFL